MTDQAQATEVIPDQTKVQNRYEIILIAILAGFTPIILKYVSRDQQALVELFNWSYLWTGLIMSFLGYIACYLSGELSRMKLFALAISAPALFSNMTGETTTAEAGPAQASNFSSANPITAVKRYLGDTKYYSIRVFASKEFRSADALARKINDAKIGLEAHIADRSIEDEWYSVVVGSARPYEAALELKKLSDSLIVDRDGEPSKKFFLTGESYPKLYANPNCAG